MRKQEAILIEAVKQAGMPTCGKCEKRVDEISFKYVVAQCKTVVTARCHGQEYQFSVADETLANVTSISLNGPIAEEEWT